jgi:hypothetical protein
MVGRCANPGCLASFQRISEDRLFQIDMRLVAGSAATCDVREHPKHVRHYWLCNRCSGIMTDQFLTDGTAFEMSKQIAEHTALPLSCKQERAA